MVFVVDDDAQVQIVMQRILERAGHRVVLCSGVADVKAALTRGPIPDVVVTDVVLLKGETGRGVADLVHRMSPRTRIALVSGYGNVKVPGETVLSKPFSAQELVEFVGQLLAAKTAEDANDRGREFERSRRRH